KEERPWGWFEQFNRNDPCTVKLIHVKAGSRLSLQYHEKRSEFWKVVKGPAIIHIDGKKFTGKSGDEFQIPTRAKHRLAAKSTSDVILLEISYGHFDEDDIIRIEDDYGRTKENKKEG
ncbi:MAG TPA: phosphomannose isomerase type II C-terminal cupin domain, partial [Nitrososphaera sp.]|nr:phosphomannose isomerase type II C-terminal cupin domain [Nitrososphaera sp.]